MEEYADALTLDKTKEVCGVTLFRSCESTDTIQLANHILNAHQLDFDFPSQTLDCLRRFQEDQSVAEEPEKCPDLIKETKLEVSLLTTNSPYAEVRAVTKNHDTSLPCSTIRAWVIGLGFVILMASINELFSIRQPTIYLETSVAQLLSYPVGKAAERFLPDIGFILFGVRHSLNPGPFNQKEHMMITIMASVGKTPPSSRSISTLHFQTVPKSKLTRSSLHSVLG